MRNSVPINIIANYAGSGWSALMGFAFVPAYVYYLGIEAYGLIGIYAVLQAWLSILDMGMSPTLYREMALLKGGAHTAQSIRDLLRSIELVYVVVAVAIMSSIGLASPWLASVWLKAESLPVVVVAQALGVTGVVVALRWLGGLYRSALTGLQEQVWLSGSNILFATLRGAGAVAVLALMSPTIEAFFIYQAIVAGLEAVCLSMLLGRLLPPSSGKTKFRFSALRQIIRFATGIMIATGLGIVLTQTDKIILSAVLSLRDFGYYALAGAVAATLLALVGPVGAAVGPKLTEIVATGDQLRLRAAYHRYSQLMALSIVPAAVVLALFMDHTLLLWTHDSTTMAAVAPIASGLVVSALLVGLSYMPLYLQLAFGWTRFAVTYNSLAVTISVPALWGGVQLFGVAGAIAVQIAAGTAYLIAGVPIMHQRLLVGEAGRWLSADVLAPLLASGSIGVGLWLITPRATSFDPITHLGIIMLAAAACQAAAMFSTPAGRDAVRRIVRLVLRWL